MFSKNLKYLREKNNIEQLELANLLGRKSASTISEWESGKYTPKIGVLSDIAKIFNVDIDDLLKVDLENNKYTISSIDTIYTQLVPPRQEKVLDFAKCQLQEQERENNDIISEDTDNYNSDNIIPLVTYPFLLNAANAGYGASDEYQYIEGMQAPKKDNADFIMKVSGDSMYPTFEDGDYVYVQKTTDLCYGNIGIFLINNTYYIKEYTKNKLVSHNKNYEDIIPNEFEDIFTIGKVLGKVKS